MHVGTRNNVFWQVQVVSQIFNTSLSQSVVVVLPRELSLDVTLGSQGLQSLDDEQVFGVNFIVLWLVVVLLGNNDTLCEMMLV